MHALLWNLFSTAGLRFALCGTPRMIDRLIELSLRNRFLVVALWIGVAGWGFWAMLRAPIDAIPDLSDNQVIVFTDWSGRNRCWACFLVHGRRRWTQLKRSSFAARLVRSLSTEFRSRRRGSRQRGWHRPAVPDRYRSQSSTQLRTPAQHRRSRRHCQQFERWRKRRLPKRFLVHRTWSRPYRESRRHSQHRRSFPQRNTRVCERPRHGADRRCVPYRISREEQLRGCRRRHRGANRREHKGSDRSREGKDSRD